MRLSNIQHVKHCRVCADGPLLGGMKGRSRSQLKGAYASLVNNATKRQLIVTISVDEAASLMTKPCTYCGAAPDPFNGIDRMDNNLGYVEGNVTPCCTTCNFAKRDMSVDQFRTWVARVFHYMEKS